MAKTCVISGTVSSPDGAAAIGITVGVRERNLPSLEQRRGGAPPILDQAITDREGRFEVRHATEGEDSPDVSLQVSDSNGRPLRIKSITPRGRALGAGDILFNVPETLDVTIVVDAIGEALSEIEQLRAQLMPSIGDIPFEALTDADLDFLVHELGLAEDRQAPERLDFVRTAAWLATASGVPLEAFYGLARQEVPAAWTDWRGLVDSERRTRRVTELLDRLAQVDEATLASRLARAAEDHLVPQIIRERATALARLIRRRALTEFTIEFRLLEESSNRPLAGYAVEAFDHHESDRPLGRDATDRLGGFSLVLRAPASQTERAIRIRISGPRLATPVDVSPNVPLPSVEPVVVRLPLPQDMASGLRQLGRDGHLPIDDSVLQKLEDDHGIRSLADIRRRGGLGRVDGLRDIDASAVKLLDAMADLERLSNDQIETTAIFRGGYASVFKIAEVPRGEFVRRLTKEGSPVSEVRAEELHVAASAQAAFLTQVFAGLTVELARGTEPTLTTELGLSQLTPFVVSR